MTKLLIATHGYLADGYISTIKVIMGEEVSNKIDSLNLFVEDQESENVNSVIDNYFRNIREEEIVIVFTDIMHGSVNQAIIPYINENTFLITGINLPLICELVSTALFMDENIEYDRVVEIINQSKNEIKFVNKILKEREQENTEDIFFE